MSEAQGNIGLAPAAGVMPNLSLNDRTEEDEQNGKEQGSECASANSSFQGNEGH